MTELTRTRTPDQRAARRNYLILCISATLVATLFVIACVAFYPE